VLNGRCYEMRHSSVTLDYMFDQNLVMMNLRVVIIRVIFSKRAILSSRRLSYVYNMHYMNRNFKSCL
jgi:hypothetical protein